MPKCHLMSFFSKLSTNLISNTISSSRFSFFMLDISKGIHEMGSIRLELAGCLLIAWLIVYCALWKGIKSFGKVEQTKYHILQNITK